MLEEYAVDPNSLGRLGPMWILMEQFGVSKGRLIAKFPKKWTKMVYSALQDMDCPDVEKSSIIDRLNRLKRCMASSTPSRSWDNQDWLQAALSTHQKFPFRALLTERVDRQEDVILTPFLATDDNPLWKVRTGWPIPRTAEAIAQCAGALGRISRELLFVDPYFSSDASGLRTLLAVLQASKLDKRVLRIEVHTTNRAGCLKEMAKQISSRVIAKLENCPPITIFKWDTKEQGDKMHPRYFLTNRGGIRFDYGLRVGGPGETTDAQLLNDELYERRWSDYQKDTVAFKLVEPQVVAS